MTDKLALYNGALRKLGESRILTLQDKGKGRRALDSAYDEVVKVCLESGLWNFAMRFVEMEATSSEATNFGYRCVFDKPDDWLRTAGVTTDPYGKQPLLDYDDRADAWLCDYETIYVRYVSIGKTFGLDLGRWPESFSQFVQFALAFETCEDVTGSDSKKDRLEKRLARAKTNASNKDAMNEPVTRFPPTGRLVRSRGYSTSEFGRRLR